MEAEQSDDTAIPKELFKISKKIKETKPSTSKAAKRQAEVIATPDKSDASGKSDSEHAQLEQTPSKRAKFYDLEIKCTECTFTTNKRLLFKKHCILNHADKFDAQFLLNQYKCDFCDKIFKDPIQLSNHKNVHLGLKPFKCVECELLFATRGELIRHTRYKHTLERPHKCTTCDYSSVELSKLKRHMRVHSDERPYLCPYCEYASRDTFKLKRHLRVHTGEKPYECPICKSCFSQSNSLKVHMKSSHKEGSRIQKKNSRRTKNNKEIVAEISEEKVTIANLSPSGSSTTSPAGIKSSAYFQATNESYYSNETYLDHSQSNIDAGIEHATYKQNDIIIDENQDIHTCNVCSMKFTSSELLDEHFVKHSGHRPFACTICNMRFGQKFALRSHVLSHDEEYTEKLRTKLKSIKEGTDISLLSPDS